jgi:hypothetical protein
MTIRARTLDIRAEMIGEHLVVTNHATGEVHRLQPVTAYVWQHADGSTSAADLVAMVQRDLGVELSETLLWSSIDQLADCGLLDGRAAPPGGDLGAAGPEFGAPPAVSRRALLAKVGVVSGVVVAGAVPGVAFAGNDKSNAGGLPACKAEEADGKQALAVSEERFAKLSTQYETLRVDDLNKRAQLAECTRARQEEQLQKQKVAEQETKQAAEQQAKVDAEQAAKTTQEQQNKNGEVQAKTAHEQEAKEQQAKQLPG